ncbi:MAG: SGNH hydrolase domain-containing protein, partial [Pseudomonadota bacterium]|nr:SGNH hydrolase domain-containing protein [Pseudomonadota bacterium]
SAFESILENPDVDTVIMLAEWAIYTEGFRDNDTPRKVRDNEGRASLVSDNATVLERSMEETMASIESAGKNIILVFPVPEFEQRANDFVEKAMFLGYAESIDQAVSLLPALDQAEYRLRNHRVLPLLEQYENKVTLLPVQHLFCEAGSCRQYDENKRLLFSDSNHVNYYGAERVVNEIFGEVIDTRSERSRFSTL